MRGDIGFDFWSFMRRHGRPCIPLLWSPTSPITLEGGALLEERLVSGGSWLGVKHSKVEGRREDSNIFFAWTHFQVCVRGRRGEQNFLCVWRSSSREERLECALEQFGTEFLGALELWQLGEQFSLIFWRESTVFFIPGWFPTMYFPPIFWL
eukprot:Gb_14967 [translate_table: standard]